MKTPVRAAAAACALTAGWPAGVRGLPPESEAPPPVRVMLVGDSLSVGPFGKALEKSLQERWGGRQVFVFASCGSSPEDWLPQHPPFVTNCGYRQTVAGRSFAREYGPDGRRPTSVRTPKLPLLLERCRPDVVIVQLGTNWMDSLAATTRPDARRHRTIIRDFITEIRRGTGSGTAIVWVMPPASSKYPQRVHEDVESWLQTEAQTLGFATIDSRRLTAPYTAGRSGGDGVHYSDSAGRQWANAVMAELPSALPLARPSSAR